jgi:hypothetical protein
MRVSRSLVGLTAVGVGVAIAACSSSKSTGPSAAKLAATFDSLYRVDSAAGSIRAQFDLLALISLNEGATPTTLSVTTDGAALSMQMVALVAYDTASAAISDSTVLVLGWTSDYTTDMATELQGTVGPDLIPRHRIGVSAARMASIRALTSRLGTGGRVGSRSASTPAVVVQGAAVANADTVSLVASEAAASGSCTFENEPTHTTVVTATSSCTNVTVTETFALHFPLTAGIAASLTHMSLIPAKTFHGTRILLTA